MARTVSLGDRWRGFIGRTAGAGRASHQQNLLTRRTGGVCVVLLTLDQFTVGWVLFYRLQNQIYQYVESVRQTALHIELQKEQLRVAQLQARLQAITAPTTAVVANASIDERLVAPLAPPALAESASLHETSGETATAPLIQLFEPETKGIVVDVEKVMTLDKEKPGMIETKEELDNVCGIREELNTYVHAIFTTHMVPYHLSHVCALVPPCHAPRSQEKQLCHNPHPDAVFSVVALLPSIRNRCMLWWLRLFYKINAEKLEVVIAGRVRCTIMCMPTYVPWSGLYSFVVFAKSGVSPGR